MATANGRELSRAERFEDEKRRIIDSCFNKKDEDGSGLANDSRLDSVIKSPTNQRAAVLETYITHIKITEYSSYPTSPPPPQARSPQTQKPRIIIVAVRKSGRVRVHKSKENPNGTFSIGKTWNLDDLTSIDSFTSPSLNPDQRSWAGTVGFVVSLGKPYYWEAQTDKEKKFFIASLLKIYGKYTGGRVPQLAGFDQQELDQILGGVQRRGGTPSAVPAAAAAPPPPRPAPPPENTSQSNLSVASGSYGAPSVTPEPRAAPRGPFAPPNAPGSPAGSIDSGRSANQAALRRLAGSNKSQDSVAASTIRSDDASSLPPRSRNGPVNGTGAFGLAETPAPEEKPPERKRPPMDPTRPQGANDEGLVPAPLSSMRTRDRDPVVPPRSSDRMSPRKPSGSTRPEIPPVNERTSTPASEPPSTADMPAPLKTPLNGSFTNVSAASATSTPRPATPQEPTEKTETPEEETRPGLGPMIKKKSRGDIAGAFWKAASAANAFKPRPGGAGERLRQAAQTKSAEGPDGITGVVPAPPRPLSVDKPKPQAEERPKTPLRNSGVPEVKITVPGGGSRPSSSQGPILEVAKKTPEPEPEQESRRSVVAGNDAKYLATLGVDPSLMNTKTGEFTKWLDYFGWVPGGQMRGHNYEEMRLDVERELNKAQAGGWLARFREEDERVGAIKKGIDVAIAECEELDNLLTLYSVELSTLSDDISYIEAQGQGLQVQAANQKLLKKELEGLLDICAITNEDLQSLRTAPLDTSAGIEEIEAALVTLFKAMIKIDPSMGTSEPRPSEDTSGDQPGLNSDFGKMRIVQEKKEMYMVESDTFMRRLVAFMASQIDTACASTRRAMEGALAKKVDPRSHDAGRELLWKYSPLILYARDVDLDNWNRIIQVYQDKSHPLYKSEFRETLDAWKRNSRKPTGEEAELLFTYQQEKKEEGIATTARKLTVKRSQTLARSLRSPLGEGSKVSVDKTSTDSRSLPYEAFAGVLDDLLPLVEMEQNFIVDFFHATTLEQADFTDVVAASRPRDRRGGDLKRHRLMEPDRELARRVTRAMEVIFAFLEQDLQNLVDWVLSQDPLQGIGVLAALERKLTDMSQSNQDYLNNVLQKLHGNLEGRFRRFVDEQIRAIEETKVKIKKRKGVISFMRTFPNFLAAVENMLIGVDVNSGARRTIDREYDRLLRTMFDSLKVIARENPAVSVGGAGSADPEDKEALNFHILLIENMNHYLEEVENPRGIEVLDEWRDAASAELAEHMGLYLNAVMRRPLGKLLEHLENVEAQLASGKTAGAVAAQPSNSKSIFNKVLGQYDAREVRKGIETLRKRVEKHFGDADDPNLSRGLVNRVTRECERFYGEVELRISRVVTDVYGGDVLFEWPRAEVKGAFSSGGR
ncbi:uncharacterized protein E0L32_011500 [Thyridium curvatum]|uniref:Exocyst complex component Sec3 PIP2-binding N-terminal domain-containing protein n=1 Tax=Thyridium curvatum TaxID=1093900 RepID=A0A507BNI8_9PEZI|nr:uncharacterized protein E0L32_011500 [Thyridium curvatum]TPX18821.1 hypothetical protein E0L32_011500 [Thyridium curvatum]